MDDVSSRKKLMEVDAGVLVQSEVPNCRACKRGKVGWVDLLRPGTRPKGGQESKLLETGFELMKGKGSRYSSEKDW